MKSSSKFFCSALLVVLLLVSLPAWSARIYKCTQPDESVTYSDIECPKDSVERENKGQTTRAFKRETDSHDPYSVIEQARRFDERNRMERMKKEMERRVAGDRRQKTLHQSR